VVELDVGQLVLAILGLLGAGGAAAEGGRRVLRRKAKPAEESEAEPAESVVSKREVADLVKHAEAEATWRSEVRNKLDTLLTRQGEHSAADERRFGEHEADLAELHRRWHDLRDKVTPLVVEFPAMKERIDETRRLAGIDSGVHDTRRRRG
jgi:hypothetical protein